MGSILIKIKETFKKVFKMLSNFLYPYRKSTTKIVCIGDSNTAFMGTWVKESNDNVNWTVLIGQQLGLEVINAGVGTGNTTIDMLSRFKTDVLDKKPAYCIIEQGANDTFNGVPLMTTINNFITMIKLCKLNNIVPIIMNCNPQFHAITWYNRFPEHRPIMDWEASDKLPAIRSWQKQYCSENNIVLIDMYPPFLLPNGQQNMDLYVKYDEVHCSDNGNRVVAKETLNVLIPLIGGY